jgi:hypothetical protein
MAKKGNGLDGGGQGLDGEGYGGDYGGGTGGRGSGGGMRADWGFLFDFSRPAWRNTDVGRRETT